MFGQCTYPKSVKIAVAVVAAEMILAAPVLVNAAATSGAASVEVVSSPSILGALSIFQIGITRPSSGASTVIDVSPDTFDTTTASGLDDDGLSRMQPAVFSISGIPDQTFSISVPLPGSADSGQGTVDFIAFEHNAGTTPTIGADGTAVFAVGAKVKVSETGDIEFTAEIGPDGETTITSEDENTTTPENTALPKVNPFGVQAVSNGFLNILVSYN